MQEKSLHFWHRGKAELRNTLRYKKEHEKKYKKKFWKIVGKIYLKN